MESSVEQISDCNREKRASSGGLFEEDVEGCGYASFTVSYGIEKITK